MTAPSPPPPAPAPAAAAAPSPDPTDAALLAAYLAERDVPCPGCGYNLRGLKAEVCPECTERPVLGLQRHGIPSWLCVLLSVACAMQAGSLGLAVSRSMQHYMFVSRGVAAGTVARTYPRGEMFTVWVPTWGNTLLAIAFLGVAAQLYRARKPQRAKTRTAFLYAFAWVFGAGVVFHFVLDAIWAFA